MDSGKNRVCPVERAGHLDNKFRRWLQNPRKILQPYITEGMTVLDYGCGPGFFTIDMAEMVGRSGRVIAADLQEGMLGKLDEKIKSTELQERIVLHRCTRDRIGWTGRVDFVLLFYVIHEIPHQRELFEELASMLQPNGRILVVEPPFHVSRAAFAESMRKAREVGFIVTEGSKVLFSKAAILQRAQEARS